MTPDQFRDLLDRLGGDLALWPARDRASAEALLAQSTEAQGDLAALREVEALLRATRADIVPDAEAIAAVATRARQEPRWRPFALYPLTAAAACACLVLGFLAGAGPGHANDPGVNLDMVFGAGDALGR